ncbi:MAG: hypothetical protein WCW03_02460 [Candidatus Paceibacterota bacterium]|jgi:Tfp pilus assembly protein PilO
MNKNVIATILFVLAIGIYFSFTSNKWTEIKAIRVVNNQYSEAIANSDKLIKVRDKVLKEYNALSAEDRDRLDKMIPNTVDNIRLIIDLNNVASRRGISLKNVKADTSEAIGGTVSNSIPSSIGNRGEYIPTPVLDEVNISFSVSASYEKFIDFMRDLEINLRVMDLTHLSVSVNESGIYDYGVELSTYWLRQQ